MSEVVQSRRTAFGRLQQQQRGMYGVMLADQAHALGVGSERLRAVERGQAPLTDGLLSKCAKYWAGRFLVRALSQRGWPDAADATEEAWCARCGARLEVGAVCGGCSTAEDSSVVRRSPRLRG